MASVVDVEATGNPYVDGLLYGVKWTGKVVYSFGDPYDHPRPPDYYVSDAQLGAAKAIIDGSVNNKTGQFQSYANIAALTQLDISRQFYVGGIYIYQSDKGNPVAIATPPTTHDPSVTFGRALNGTAHDLRTPSLGNYAYLVHLQMFGEMVGLKPASETGGVDGAAVPTDRDALEYTVMSQRSYPGGPASTDYTVGAWDHPQTYMALDILAMQTLYGADYTSYATDTIYGWNPLTGQMSLNGKGNGTPGANKIFMTIWDGGGNDTYDFSAYATSVIVDLAPGASSLASQAQRAFLGDGVYARGNIYNSYLFHDNPASLIENAIGGSANDTLRGNQADNVLNGGGGADTLTGLTGNDSYVVDDLRDTIVEAAGEGTDMAYVRVSGFVLPANVENAKIEDGFGDLEVRGNSLANVLTGNADDNAIYGGAGADQLYGKLGNDHLDGGTGPDVMVGGSGDDTYIVDNFSDVVYEAKNQGNDTLWTSVNRGLDNNFENIVLFGAATVGGGNSLDNIVSGNELNNELWGGGGIDSLYGHGGSDRLFGEAGNDYMTGGKGIDAYYGGAGYDYAILEKGGGLDYFVDWNVAQDRVVFDSAIFPSIGAALTAAFQNGTDVVIWDGHDGIVLQNAKLTELTTSNFLFV